MQAVPADTPYYRELQGHEAMYVKLLADLRERAGGPQKELPMRDPGEEG
jgi:hypothetical protein